MKTLTKLLNALGLRTSKQRRSTSNRSLAQKAAWTRRKSKVPTNV